MIYVVNKPKRYPPPNRNYKVVWIGNGRQHDLPDAYNKTKAFCNWFVKRNRNNARFVGGSLAVMPMVEKGSG
jgi:predicted alpha/beta superfamily hydrolase